MIKLVDILKELLVEGINLDKTTGKTIISNTNNSDDLLFTGGLKEATISGVDVWYSIEYNKDNPNADDMAILADNIKELKNVDQTQIHDLIKKDIEKLLDIYTFKPKTVYYLDSSAPLSKLIGNIIKEIDPKIDVLPLYKIKWPSSKDLLVSNYKELISSPSILSSVEEIAQKVWEKNDGKFKSTGIPPKYRAYFKSKYDLDKILEKNSILFVDDNIQTGTDFKSINDKFKDSSHIAFYTAIRLSRTGKKTTPASIAAKSNKIPSIFKFTESDLKQFSNGLGLKSTYNELKKLQDKGYVEKGSTVLPNGTTYYFFKNKELKIADLLKK